MNRAETPGPTGPDARRRGAKAPFKPQWRARTNHSSAACYLGHGAARNLAVKSTEPKLLTEIAKSTGSEKTRPQRANF